MGQGHRRQVIAPGREFAADTDTRMAPMRGHSCACRMPTQSQRRSVRLTRTPSRHSLTVTLRQSRRPRPSVSTTMSRSRRRGSSITTPGRRGPPMRTSTSACANWVLSARAVPAVCTSKGVAVTTAAAVVSANTICFMGGFLSGTPPSTSDEQLWFPLSNSFAMPERYGTGDARFIGARAAPAPA
jgi:hypothetical protein